MRSLQDHFLIAMPAMEDPNFNATVTYLCKHDAGGALGVIINRPSDTSLGELLGQLDIEPLDSRASGAPRAARRPRRARARLRAAPLDASVRRHLRHGRRDQGDRVERHPGRGRARRDRASPTSSRSATPAGAAASSKRSCSRTRGSRCEADPALVFETPFEQRWTAAVGLLGVDAHQITSYAGHA